MAAFRTYARTLWNTQVSVCSQLGIDLTTASQVVRIQMICTDIMMAGLIKVLTDAGVITDAQLKVVFDAITAATFPSQPMSIPVPLDETQVTATPDFGS